MVVWRVEVLPGHRAVWQPASRPPCLRHWHCMQCSRPHASHATRPSCSSKRHHHLHSPAVTTPCWGQGATTWRENHGSKRIRVRCRAAAPRQHLYELLGLDASCSAKAVRLAYRQLATLWHPDVAPIEEGPKAEATRKFKALSQAYEVLKDPNLRSRYDTYGLRGLGREYAPLRDYFQGEGTPESAPPTPSTPVGVRGEDVYAVLGLDLSEAVTGAERVVEVEVAGVCASCQGFGRALPTDGTGTACRVCRGSGEVLRSVWQPTGFKVVQLGECPGCGGAGTLLQAATCTKCRGEGRVPAVTRRINLRVPGGVDADSVLRVPGCGHAGKWGGPPGDLRLRFKVHNEPTVERRGQHLYSTIKCGVWQALLGASIPVRSMRGSGCSACLQVLVPGPLHGGSMPAGSQHGDVVQLTHAGVATAQAGVVEYGHHYFEVQVEIPNGTHMQEGEAQLLRQLHAAHQAGGAYADH